MPENPIEPRAWATALPWGSRTPSLGMMKTRAFTGALSLHRRRAFDIAGRAFGQNAKTPRNFLISLLDLAEVAAEAVLVELLVGLHVPEAAIIGADLVSEHQAHLVVLVIEPAEFELEVDEPDADAEEQAREEIVDAERHLHDLVEILGRGPAKAGDVLLGDHRIAELVVLVIVLNDRAWQGRSFGDAEALRQGAGDDIADDDLDRNDLHLANELLAHVEAAHEMRRNADVGKLRHQELADAVVDDAFPGDGAALLRVESGGVVLEILDKRSGLGALEHHLGLAFIDLLASSHRGDLPAVRVEM